MADDELETLSLHAVQLAGELRALEMLVIQRRTALYAFLRDLTMLDGTPVREENFVVDLCPCCKGPWLPCSPQGARHA